MARHKTGKQLEDISRLPDMKWATRIYATQCKYTRGQTWSFWIEEDPRFENGINEISKFQCIKSGEEDSEWIELKT